MARLLHLVKAGDAALATATIARQVAAGDTVTVALLPGAPAAEFPGPARVVRVPEEAPYATLLELIFEADRVVAW